MFSDLEQERNVREEAEELFNRIPLEDKISVPPTDMPLLREAVKKSWDEYNAAGAQGERTDPKKIYFRICDIRDGKIPDPSKINRVSGLSKEAQALKRRLIKEGIITKEDRECFLLDVIEDTIRTMK